MPSGHFLQLAELSTEAIREHLAAQPRSVALLTTGATEAHGPHLPLATDTIISEEMLRRGGLRLAAEGMLAVRLPALNYALTDWARAFPGTISLKEETATALVLEVCVAATRMGFARVAICNAHLEPENVALLRNVATRYFEETGTKLVFPDVTRRANAARLGDEFRSGSCHAGEYESSLVMAVRPDLVPEEVRTALPELFVPMHERYRDGARDFLSAGMMRAYCGHPATATVDEGERLYEQLAEMLATAVIESFA